MHILHAQKEERIVGAIFHKISQIAECDDLIANSSSRIQAYVGLDAMVFDLKILQIFKDNFKTVHEKVCRHLHIGRLTARLAW